MMLLPNSAKQALGLHIDGQQVQVAYLRRQGKRVSVLGLKRAGLITRLDVRHGEEEQAESGEAAQAGDLLGLETPSAAPEARPASGEEGGEAPSSNTDVLFRLLADYPASKCDLAVSLLDGRVFFTEYPDSFGLKGKALKARLLEESRKERALEETTPLAERHGFFRTSTGKILSIVHEDPLEILDLIDGLREFVGRLRVRLIDPLEIALMGLVRTAYSPEEKVTGVVYVGQGFSQVLFMQNGEYLAFSQPIHEGSFSPQVLSTVSSRILFEQDVSSIPEIGRLLLAGDCQRLEAREFFAEQFSGVQVDYLELPDLDVSALDEETQKLVPAFAVPIGLALKILQPAASYPTNFLPRRRKRQQNPLEVGWHTLLLLTLLLASGLGTAWKVQDQSREIEQMRAGVALSRQQLAESQAMVPRVEEAGRQIEAYQQKIALLDTLSGRQMFWSRRLCHWSSTIHAIGDLWLLRFGTTEGDLDVGGNWGEVDLPLPERAQLHGMTIYRMPAAELAQQLRAGTIRWLKRAEIREKTLFEFDMVVPVAITDSTIVQEP